MDEYIAKIVKQQVKKGKIHKGDEELYQYGYLLLIEKTVALLMTMIIAMLFHAFWNVLLFYIVFIPMRSYAGGYHAEKTKTCLILSGGILILYILLTRILLMTPYGIYTYITELFLLPAIWTMAPVQHKNKMLSESERKHYGSVVKVIYAIHIVCEIIALILGKNEIVIGFVLSHSAVFFSLVIGRIDSERS